MQCNFLYQLTVLYSLNLRELFTVSDSHQEELLHIMLKWVKFGKDSVNNHLVCETAIFSFR